MLAGIKDILIISDKGNLPNYKKLLTMVMSWVLKYHMQFKKNQEELLRLL